MALLAIIWNAPATKSEGLRSGGLILQSKVLDRRLKKDQVCNFNKEIQGHETRNLARK